MKSPESVNSARATVDIITPTFDNDRTLTNFLTSLLRYTGEPFRLILVNNGTRPIEASKDPRVVVLNMGKNLGWIGGVNAGLKFSAELDPAPFVCFLNDDIQILDHDYGWLTKMVNAFQLDEKVGAVGPISNAVMGLQSSQFTGLPPNLETTRLSGMCFLVSRKALRSVGPLDESLPGGDDLDYSMRLRTSGYKLCICRRTFLIHHYGQTGKRVWGEYWDSRDHSEAINKALIQKHGFKLWFDTVNDRFSSQQGGGYDFLTPEDKMAYEAVKSSLGGVVLDLGCGGKKIDPLATGVDIRPNGGLGVGVNCNVPSSADVVSDVAQLAKFQDNSVDAILARHIFEHIIDPIQALKEWKRVLKPNGRLAIICPDYRYCEAISCDPSHVHAYTPDSVLSLLHAVGGFKTQSIKHVRPGYVFMVEVAKHERGTEGLPAVSGEAQSRLPEMASVGGAS